MAVSPPGLGVDEGPLTARSLAQLPLVVTPSGTSTRRLLDRLLSRSGLSRAQSLEQRLGYLALMREALTNSAELTSLYVGYGNGDFPFFTLP